MVRNGGKQKKWLSANERVVGSRRIDLWHDVILAASSPDPCWLCHICSQVGVLPPTFASAKILAVSSFDSTIIRLLVHSNTFLSVACERAWFWWIGVAPFA